MYNMVVNIYIEAKYVKMAIRFKRKNRCGKMAKIML